MLTVGTVLVAPSEKLVVVRNVYEVQWKRRR